MKRMKFYYMFLFILFTGCSDFLKEEDKDLVIPRTVDHYEAMINKFYVDIPHYIYSDLMTDDVADYTGGVLENKNEFKSVFTWQLDLELTGNGDQNTNLNNGWSKHYTIIATLNYILDEIDKAEGDEATKMYLKGVAYFMRGRSYFELVNLYAQHYEKETAKRMPGVPLRLTIGVQDTYEKSSIEDVYFAVERDLKNAIVWIERSGVKKNVRYVNSTVAKLLLSRVYLYKSDYENCEEYATQVLTASGGVLWDLVSFYRDPVVTFGNPEILHTYGDPENYLICDNLTGNMQPYYNKSLNFQVAEGLRALFLRGDRRLNAYLVSVQNVYLPARISDKYTSLGAFNYRNSEAYLNRAEALVMQGNTEGAYADVLEVVKHRTSYHESVQIPTDQDGLRKFIYAERRREFCFEGQRWFDLKRWKDQRTMIERSFTQTSTEGVLVGTEKYRLMKNDPNYVLPLPNLEIKNNPMIHQYDRYDKMPIKY